MMSVASRIASSSAAGRSAGARAARTAAAATTKRTHTLATAATPCTQHPIRGSAAVCSHSRIPLVASSVPVSLSNSAPSVAAPSSSRSRPRPFSSAFLRAACAAAVVSLASFWLLDGAGTIHAQAADDSAAAAAESDRRPHTRLPQLLTPVERAQLRALSLWLRDQPPSPARDYMQRWALGNDWTLLRYLIAHKLKVPEAGAAIMATVRWRMENGVDDLRVGEFARDFKEGGLYVSAESDPVGRAIIAHKKSGAEKHPAAWTPEQQRHDTRALIYTLERAVREMEDRVDRGESDGEEMDYKWVMLLDVRHYTRGSAAPLSSTHSMIDMLRSHYPERLHYMVLIEPTWLMRMVGGIVKATLPPLTRLKISWTSDERSLHTQQLLSTVVGSLDRLPLEWDLIGARTRFNFDKYVESDPLAQPRPMVKPFQPRKQVEARAAAEAAAASRPWNQTEPSAAGKS